MSERYTFNVVSLDKLVVAKRTAGRPKDLAMLPELEAILEYQKLIEAGEI